MINNKILWISIIQGLAMLMVVIGHCWLVKGTYIFDFCYGVHMPLFMFVSGGLFYITRINKNWLYKDVLIEKLLRLGIPYVFFITFAFCIKCLTNTIVKHPIDCTLSGFLLGFIIPSQSAMKEMWFVASLFLLMTMYPILKISLRHVVYEVILLFAFICLSFLCWDYIGGGVLNYKGIFRYGVFFYLGILCFKYEFYERLKNKYIAVSSLVLYGCICTYRQFFYLPVALIGIIALTSLCLTISKKSPFVLKTFRDYSFQIFLLGIYPQMLVEMFFSGRLTGLWQLPFGFMSSVALGIYIPVFIVKSVKKINSRYINIVIGIK